MSMNSIGSIHRAAFFSVADAVGRSPHFPQLDIRYAVFDSGIVFVRCRSHGHHGKSELAALRSCGHSNDPRFSNAQMSRNNTLLALIAVAIGLAVGVGLLLFGVLVAGINLLG
jgi:hypothetical protein